MLAASDRYGSSPATAKAVTTTAFTVDWVRLATEGE